MRQTMNIGEKIKKVRLSKRMTQSELAGDKLTRNMISSIESGKASPSLDTLMYIADILDLPAPYLLSENDDLFFFEKKERIGAIKNALDEKNYTVCINLVLKLEKLDDELYFILADCYFNLGVSSAKNGALQSALHYLELCLQYCDKTIYDTARFKAIIPLYTAISKNVNAPLLEFEDKKFYSFLTESTDFEFYKYLTLDLDYEYTYKPFSLHAKAKQLIRERKYSDAIQVLLEIENTKSNYEYNSYLMYGIYTDLDACYRFLFDFESAYRYASKRISLLEGFKF